MKKVTKEYEVFTIDELSDEAKKKARQDYVSNNDYPFLSDCMNEKLHELLEKYKIVDQNDTSKPGTKPTPVLYSLASCQGDGAMFEGSFLWKHGKKEYHVNIKQVGNYSHYNSKEITMHYFEVSNGIEDEIEADEETYTVFDGIYKEICKKLEQYGYDFIEYEDSMENFIETCEANEYTFLADGKMVNY